MTPVLKKLVRCESVTEIIVVNDGSTDGTAQALQQFHHKKLKVVTKQNGGKGSAVIEGLNHVSHEFVLIQDADLEYDPEDIPHLLEPIEKQQALVVYGSRFLGPHSNLLFWHRKGNDLLNFLINILYNTTLSDMETCYKIMPTQLLRQIKITGQKFDIEPEITCKLLLQKIVIFEVPITYVGRDFSQGKKIGWRDGVDALKVILSLKLWPPRFEQTTLIG